MQPSLKLLFQHNLIDWDFSLEENHGSNCILMKFYTKFQTIAIKYRPSLVYIYREQKSYYWDVMEEPSVVQLPRVNENQTSK